jgi:hypothetical protein
VAHPSRTCEGWGIAPRATALLHPPQICHPERSRRTCQLAHTQQIARTVQPRTNPAKGMYDVRMKRWLKIGALVTLGLLLTAFATYWIFELSDSRAQREQYAVYSAYLSQALQTNNHDFGDGLGLLIIMDHTIRPASVLPPEELKAASTRMRRDLNLHSLRTIHFKRSFEIPTNYKLMHIGSGSFDSDGNLIGLSLEERRASRGNAYVVLSRISFNSTATVAMFYTGYLNCSLCGGHEYVLMQKQSDRWRVVETYSSSSS